MTVPCECGSTDVYWRGPEDGGLRVYLCDECWEREQRLAPDELDALRRFADRYSPRTWKRALRFCWESGTYGWSEDAAVLQRLRNRLGPGRLHSFRFPRTR